MVAWGMEMANFVLGIGIPRQEYQRLNTAQALQHARR
jgi:hypothetical protein